VSEIKWTADGEAFGRSLVPQSREWLALMASIRKIREEHAYGFWDITKALTNNRGDEAKALADLTRAASN